MARHPTPRPPTALRTTPAPAGRAHTEPAGSARPAHPVETREQMFPESAPWVKEFRRPGRARSDPAPSPAPGQASVFVVTPQREVGVATIGDLVEQLGVVGFEQEA